MDIKYNQVGSNLLISVTGDIDLYNISKLKNALMESINPKVKNLILDLKDILYMDSSGIGALVGAHKKMKQNGGKLSIINVQDDVMELFRLASLHHFFNIYKDGSDQGAIPIIDPKSTAFYPPIEHTPSPAILKKKPKEVQRPLKVKIETNSNNEKSNTQKENSRKLTEIQFKGWVNAHTFRVPADGYPRKTTKNREERKKEAKNAAIKIAQIMVLEHFVGSYKNKNWVEFHNYRKGIYARFSKIVVKGKIKLAKYDPKENCTIIYEIRSKNLRENILNEFEKSKARLGY